MSMYDYENLDEKKIWELWKKHKDDDAGNYLVKKYMPLVKFHTQRMLIGLPKNVRQEDIYSQGLLGLFDAIEKFDVDRELIFETYASFRIKGAIIDYLRKEDWLSRASREKIKKIEKTANELEQKYLRPVTPQEIAEAMGLTEDEVNQSITESFFSTIISVDDLSRDQDDEEVLQVNIKDQAQRTPEQIAVQQEQLVELMCIIKSDLNEREQMILQLLYKEELTLTEISTILGISTSRVSQIHSKCLLRLRKILLSQETEEQVWI